MDIEVKKRKETQVKAMVTKEEKKENRRKK